MNITLTGNTITVITALRSTRELTVLTADHSLRGQHIGYEKVKPAILYENLILAIKWYEK